MAENPPRILFVCVRMPYPALDGGSIAMWNMVRGFARLGWEVDVLAVNTPKAYSNLNSLTEEARASASWTAVTMDTRPNLLDALGNLLFSRKSYHITRFEHHTFAETLKGLLQQRSYTVVQFETAIMAAYAPLARRYTQARLAMRAHNVEHEIWERRMANERNPLKAYYFEVTSLRLKTFETQLLESGHLDALTPITQRDADRFAKMGWKGKTFVCPSGYQPDLLPATGAPERPSVFYLGALDWEPNVEGLLWFLKEVWPKVFQQRDDARLYVAGRHMPQWMQKLRIPGAEMLGEVPDARAFMQQYDLMAAPVLSGSGMRVKLVEAMAAGKPIVATPMAAEGLAVRHGEHLMLANTPELFSNHLLALMARPDLADLIGGQARAWVLNHLNNDTWVGKLAEFYLALPLPPASTS